MSSIVFTFDAQAIGVLEALGAIADGIQQVIDMSSQLGQAFINVNANAETLGAALGTLFANYNQVTGATDTASQSMSKASQHAANLAYQLDQIGQRAQDAAQSHQDATEQILQQEQNLTVNTQEEIQKREDTFNNSMQRLIDTHQNTMDTINAQEQTLSENYLDTINNRLLQLQNPSALQHKEIVTSLEQQIAAILSSGSTTGLTTLEQQLTDENTKYTAFLQNTIEPYYQYLDQKGYQHHTNALNALQKRLDTEQQKYTQQSAWLVSQRDAELANIQTHYQQQELALQEHLDRENQRYANQVATINLERQHILDSSGLSSGGGGGSGITQPMTPPPGLSSGKDIAIFKMLGIDPTQDPQAAVTAIQDWIIGTAFHGISFGRGEAFNTQMTIQQVQTVVGQALALGQDPTKAWKGNENYVDLFSNLLAFTKTTAPTRSDAARFNSLVQIMEKIMSGNQQGLMRQLGYLGINKELLQKYGIQFGGPRNATIENPSDMLDAILGVSHGVAPGLGKTEGTTTFSGLINQFKDLWYRVSQSIGDPFAGGGLWKQFDAQLSRMLNFLFSHQQDFIKFGQTIFTGVINAFKSINDFLASSQGNAMLHGIAHGFHAIGDALKWIGAHKSVFALLMGLFAVQGVSKLAGGITGLFGGLTSGGLFGGIGSLLGGGGQSPDQSTYQKFYESFSKKVGKAGDTAALSQQFDNEAQNLFGNLTATGTPEQQGFFRNFLRSTHHKSLSDSANADVFDSVLGGLNQPTTSPGLLSGLGGWLNDMIGIHPRPGMANALSGARSAVAGGATTAGNYAQLIGFGHWRLVMQDIATRAAPVTTAVQGAVSGGMGAISSVGGALAGGGSTVLQAIAMIISGNGGPTIAAIASSLGGFALAVGPLLVVVGLIAGLIAALVINREKIMPFIHTIMDFFGTKLVQAEKALQKFIGEIQSRFSGAFGPGSFIHALIMVFEAFWEGSWSGIKTIFLGVWNIIEGVIRIAWSIVSGIILIGMDLLGGKWGMAWNDLKNLVGGVFDGIGHIFHGAFLIFAGIFSGFFGGLWASISGHTSDFSNNIMSWITSMGNGIVTFFTQTIPTTLSNAWGTIFSLFKSGLSTMINQDLPGPLASSVHSMLGFASGGYYGGSDIALVGETGPELFFRNNPGAIVSNDQIRAAIQPSASRNMNNTDQRSIIITGPVSFNGVQDILSFYRKMNAYAGTRAEFGKRGSAL